MKKLFTLACTFSLIHSAYASHLLGGEVANKRLQNQGLTYRITANLYMDERGGRAAADGQSQITICVGENNQTITATRTIRTNISADVSLNIYQTAFTYAAPGTFTVSVTIENRNAGLANFNSVNTPFYIQTTFATHIMNTTPVLNSSIGTQAAYSKQVFKDNVNAIDAKGDSVVYGELTWNAPVQVGSYAYAIIVEEWRDGMCISETQREVTLEVRDQGGAPVIIPPFEYPGNKLITGIEPESGEFVQIFPSPAQRRVNVTLQSTKPSKALFQPVDVKGKIVDEYQETERYLTHNHDFNVANLPQGVYFIRMLADKTVTRKFINE